MAKKKSKVKRKSPCYRKKSISKPRRKRKKKGGGFFKSKKALQRGTGGGSSNTQPIAYSAMHGFNGRNVNSYDMRGAGIASIFSSIFRGLMPVLKGAVKVGKKTLKSPLGKLAINEAKDTAAQAGLNIIGDTLQGKNVLKSAKTRTKQSVKDLEQRVTDRVRRGLAAAAAPPTSTSARRGTKRKNTSSNARSVSVKKKKVAATKVGIVKRQMKKKKKRGRRDLLD